MKQDKWDDYFMNIAREVSKNSKCMSRKIGAVLVKDKAIISTGFNGPARGVKHCNERMISFYRDLNGGEPWKKEWEGKTPEICPRRLFEMPSGQGLHLCQAGHSERNTLIQAARNGISTLDTTLYCYCGQVCFNCAIEIVNAGVKELVYLEGCPTYDSYAETILKESDILVRQIKEPK